MRRLILVVPAFLLLACEHLVEQPPAVQPRSKRESAAELLRVELQLAALEDFLQYVQDIQDRQDRLEAVRFLRAHISRCEGWLEESETNPRRLAAAHVGLDLVGVGYDLIRTDVQATQRHLGGLARPAANAGLNTIWRRIRSLERDPTTATNAEVTADLLDAKDRRDDLLRTVPAANFLRPGVLAASNTSSAYGLAKAATAAGPALGRLARLLANPEGAAMGVEISAGGVAALSVVAGSGALVLTEAEIIALAQASAISVTAIKLAMMASGRPPKVPDPERFAEWVKNAPTRPAQQPEAQFGKYQIKVAGPTERLLRATSGEEIWADGVREADCRLLEAKFAKDPDGSPFVSANNLMREKIRDSIRAEFIKYAAVLRDPSSPAIALEVITNEPRAVAFFESLLKELGITGEVVVRPFL
jgi:hypothetical protein